MKNYNFKKIRDKVRIIVKRANDSYENFYGDTFWRYHVLAVLKHGLALGKKLKADLQVIELAVLLHDIAAIKDKKLDKEHHLHGAKMAEEILNKTALPREKIDKIMSCILSHRASKKIKRQSLEAEILASADAMSHFSELADMMYLAYGIRKYKTKPGALWLKRKLARSWQKTMPQGKLMIKKDYEIAMAVLDQALK